MRVRLRQDGLGWQELDDEVVVLDLDGSAYFKVNGSGRVLWERLQEPATLDDLVAALTAVYDIDAAQARADAEQFVADLRERDLVQDV